MLRHWKLISTLLFLLLFCSCTGPLEKRISSSSFYRPNHSPKIMGHEFFTFDKETFVFRNNRHVVGEMVEPSMIGYSGTYRIEKTHLILKVEEVRCCHHFIVDKKEAQIPTKEIKIRGSRFVDCEYYDYAVDSLNQWGIDYKGFCRDTLRVNASTKKLEIMTGDRSYVKRNRDR